MKITRSTGQLRDERQASQGAPRQDSRAGHGQEHAATGPRLVPSPFHGVQHVGQGGQGGAPVSGEGGHGRLQYAVALAPYGQLPPVHPAHMAASTHFAQLRMMGADHLLGMHTSALGYPFGVGPQAAPHPSAAQQYGMAMEGVHAGLYAHAQGQSVQMQRKRSRETMADQGPNTSASHSILSHSSPHASTSVGGTSTSTAHTGNTGSGSSTGTGASGAQLCDESSRHNTSERGGSGSAFSSSSGGTGDSPRSRSAGHDAADNNRGESLSAGGSTGSHSSGTGGQQDSADGSNSGHGNEDGRASGDSGSSVSDDGKQDNGQANSAGEAPARTAVEPPHFYGPHTMHTAGMHSSPWQIPGYNNPLMAPFYGMGMGGTGGAGQGSAGGQQGQGGYVSMQGAQNAHFQSMVIQYMQAAAMGQLGHGVSPFAAMQMAMMAAGMQGMMQGSTQGGGSTMGPPSKHEHHHNDGSSRAHAHDSGRSGVYHEDGGATGGGTGEGGEEDDDMADMDEELPEGVEFYIPSDDVDESSGPSKGKKSKKGKMDEREKAKVSTPCCEPALNLALHVTHTHTIIPLLLSTQVTEFIARLTSGSLIVARGDLARALQDYVNPTRPREFYEKLVSRRGMNQDFTHLLAPRRPRKRRLPGEKGLSPGGEQRFFTHRRKLSGTEGQSATSGGGSSGSVSGGAGSSFSTGSAGQVANQHGAATGTGNGFQHGASVASLPDSSVQAALTVRQQAAAFQAGILYAQSRALRSAACTQASE